MCRFGLLFTLRLRESSEVFVLELVQGWSGLVGFFWVGGGLLDGVDGDVAV